MGNAVQCACGPYLEKSNKKRQVPPHILRARTWKGRESQTQYVKKYFEQDEDTRILGSLLNFMDAELRNAIVHMNYYIDEESKAMVFLPKPKKGTTSEGSAARISKSAFSYDHRKIGAVRDNGTEIGRIFRN